MSTITRLNRLKMLVGLLLLAFLGAVACGDQAVKDEQAQGVSGAARVDAGAGAEAAAARAASVQPLLVRTGMDPGMTRRLATTLYPLSRSYTEFCPDLPSGCKATLRSGDRFYTLAANMSGINIPLAEDKTQCRIDSREPVPTSVGIPAPCPYEFAWKKTAQGRPLSSVAVDTTKFPTTTSAYAYFGLQENVGTPMGHLATGRPSSEIFAGIPAPETDTYRPEVRSIERLDLDVRAKFCLGNHAKDPHYGRIAVYVLWFDSVTGKGRELSIDLMAYKSVPPGTDVPLLEYFFEEQAWYHARGGPAPNPARWVGHIDGPLWGVVPPKLKLQRDTTKDCSAAMTGEPVHLELPIGDIFRRLIREGHMAPELLSGRYVGALVNGVETWGRGRLESELSGFTLWRKR